MKCHGLQSWLFGKAYRSCQIQNTDQRNRGFTPKLIVSVPKQSMLMPEVVGAKSLHGWMKHRLSYRTCLKAQAKDSMGWVVFVGLQVGGSTKIPGCSASLAHEPNLNQSGNQVWDGIAQGGNSLKILMVIPRAKDPQSKFFSSVLLFGTLALIKQILDSYQIKMKTITV